MTLECNPSPYHISSTKSPFLFAQELAERALTAQFFDTYWNPRRKNKLSGPGKVIESLSEQEKEVIQQLKPEHFNHRYGK